MALMPHPEVDGGGVYSGSYHHLCKISGKELFFLPSISSWRAVVVSTFED
jgi:hypothetical protein